MESERKSVRESHNQQPGRPGRHCGADTEQTQDGGADELREQPADQRISIATVLFCGVRNVAAVWLETLALPEAICEHS